jgi:hypothetical protein
MPTNTEIKNNTSTDLSPIRILVAESDLVEIDRIKSLIDPAFRTGIRIVKTYYQLVESVPRERPHLVVLGKIDNSNYADISKACHKNQSPIPIVLLSSQTIIIDSFRKLVRTCGLTDVIGRDSDELNQLIQALAESIQQTDREMRQHLMSEPLGSGFLDADGSTLEARGSKLPTVNPVVQPQSALIAPPIAPPPAQPVTNKSINSAKLSGAMLLEAMDEIVDISNNFFGPLAQGNYWRKARDRAIDQNLFLESWSADHFGKLHCDEHILTHELTEIHLNSLRTWVRLFIEECERIIVDYQTILRSSDLSQLAKDLLPKV